MTRPEAPECLPQKTSLQLWRGPGRCQGEGGRAASVWNRMGEASERVFPQESAGNPGYPSPLSRKDKVSASVVPCEYSGGGQQGDCVLPAI